MYGKKIKNLAYKTSKHKLAFNSRFFSLIVFLETRLNIVILRLGFCSKLLHANEYIASNNISINNKCKNSNYILKIGDFLRVSVLAYSFSIKKRFTSLL